MKREQVGVAGAVGMGGVQDAGPVRTTDSGFSVSNIADIYAANTVTQRCQNRHLLPATIRHTGLLSVSPSSPVYYL